MGSEMKKPLDVKIVQQPEKEVSTEILANSIVAISEGMRAIRRGRLNERALLILIKDATGHNVSMKNIKDVISAIENLQKLYVK